jgi:hypothetical protein
MLRFLTESEQADIADYKLGATLGEGTFGKVWSGSVPRVQCACDGQRGGRSARQCT